MTGKLFPTVPLPNTAGALAPGSALTPQMLRLLGRPIPPPEPPPEAEEPPAFSEDAS